MGDDALVAYVQAAINSGATAIHVPFSVAAGASDEAIREVKRLCQLCGVRITGIDV